MALALARRFFGYGILGQVALDWCLAHDFEVDLTLTLLR